ncbi:MAG: hypothetical protein HQK60_05210 [Deltaproteobacteria bacterium]|nr:hypothetical protein [Deltaproteobacteria bacterium]
MDELMMDFQNRCISAPLTLDEIQSIRNPYASNRKGEIDVERFTRALDSFVENNAEVMAAVLVGKETEDQ